MRRKRRQAQPEPTPQPTSDLHERALAGLRETAATNPRLGALLDEIDRGREHREAGHGTSGHELGREIAAMQINEIAYTVPWAMRWAKDGDGYCLRSSFPTTHEAWGTSQMRIMRTADGFRVWWNKKVDRRSVEWLNDSLPVVEVVASA